MLVELWGEFAFFSLGDLCATLNRILDLGRKTLVDLSGITFLDLSSARELAVRAQLYDAHRLTLHNPSLQVTASFKALGLANWLPFHSRTDREEPPLVSEAPLELQLVQCSYCR